MKSRVIASAIAALIFGFAPVVSALDYEKDIVPLLKERCYECHSNEKGKTKGNLVLDDIEEMRDYQVAKFSLIRPGNPEESQFLDLMKLPEGDSDAMPPKGERMAKKDLEVIEHWIREGATIDGLTRNAEGEEVEMVETEEKPSALEAAPVAEYLAWTNTEGREIEARFIRLEGDKVLLLMRDGKSYPYPLAKLSEQSQAQAKQLEAAAKAGANADADGASGSK